MSGTRARIFHEPEDAYPELEEIGREPEQHSHRTKLPVIPDLRFEYSYLKSIQHFVEVEGVEEQGGRTQTKRVERFDQSFLDNERKGRYAEEQELIASGSNFSPREVVKVQWRRVLWVTMRDQVISPLVQGALWALASYYLNPLSSRFGVATLTNGHKPTNDGEGISWLRNWLQSLRIRTDDNRSTAHTSRQTR